MNPVRADGGSVEQIVIPMFDILLGTDKNGKIAPMIVEKWEIAPDSLSWSFYIHKGVKFHNGEDLTADDVKFTLERFMSKDSFYPYLANMIDRVEVVNDYTVRVYTKGRQPLLPTQVSMTSSAQRALVMPKDYIGQYGEPYFEKNPVGSGPFVFARRIMGDSVSYEAVDKHWRQVPAFKTLAVILVPDEATRMAMLKTGAVDVIDVGIENAQDLVRTAGVTTDVIRYRVPMVLLHGAYDPRGGQFPTSDIRVRQALSLAINRQEINAAFFLGKAGPIVAPALVSYSHDIDVQYWMDYSAKAYRYDPQGATQLLREAGYASGFNIRIYSYVMGQSPFLPMLAEVVQGYWQKIGVRASIVPMDWGKFSTIRNPLKFAESELIGQASLPSHGGTVESAKNVSTLFSTADAYALLGKTSPEMDKLIVDAYVETDPNKRKEILAKAIKIGIDAYVSLPIGQSPVIVASGPRVSIDLPKPAVSVTAFADIAQHRQ